MYEKIKRFYDLGLYNDSNVSKFAQHGHITEEQYMEITGKKYILQ